MGNVFGFIKNSIIRKIPIIGPIIASFISVLEALYDPIGAIQENWRNIIIFGLVFTCTSILVTGYHYANKNTIGLIYGIIAFVLLMLFAAVIFQYTKCPDKTTIKSTLYNNNLLIFSCLIFGIMHYVFLANPIPMLNFNPAFKMAKKILGSALGSVIFGFLISSYYSSTEIDLC